MSFKHVKSLCVATTLCMSHAAHAGIINGGELLDQSGASFLETRLGLGDLDFTNISNLSAGALSTDWHDDVRGYTNVISIYDVTFDNKNYLLGGYSTIGHDGLGYSSNSAATSDNFLFNISLGIVHNTQNGPWSGEYDQHDHSYHFATFGGGHDLFGGGGTLGSEAYVHAYSAYNNGYSYGGGDHLLGSGVTGFQWITINGLESFVFESASVAGVPEPATIALFGLGLAVMGVSRKLKKS